MKAVNQNLRGFKTLWIAYDKESTDKHQLFFKEHSIRKQEPEYPKGRTLFVLNIPPYAETAALKHVFSELCGNVSQVTFTTPTGFKTGYVVFEKEFALDRALELSPECTIILNPEYRYLTGLMKWCKEYNESICDESALKKEIEDYMNEYDKRIADRIAREKAAEEEAAAGDGWVTVTGRKKRGQFALARKESTILKVQNKEEHKNKKKQLLNFYTFQIREAKKQNLAELRKKFELDKKRLQELKTKRTFRPF